MKKTLQILIIFLSIVFVFSCKEKKSKDNSRDRYESTYSDDTDYDEDGRIEDDTYSATVDYYNPSTGYSATYTLDVEVEDGEVTVIYFPNDGYLDDDHIYPSELDDDGYVEIEGEEGKTYGIQIDF